MNILHILDPDTHGGALVAAESVMRCVGGSRLVLLKATRAERAVRTVAGFCSSRARLWLRQQMSWMKKPDVVHLHNFKAAGTAVIATCKDLGLPVVWSAYDYWCVDPHDIASQWDWWRYRPARERSLPRICNLALIGRNRRICKWLNRLDGVICLSYDSKDRLRAAGIDRPQMHVVPLPITVPQVPTDKRDPDKVLYIGGSPTHKGRHVFCEAMDLVRATRPAAYSAQLSASSRPNALRSMAQAACLVVPELWPNPGPVSIVEAQLLGTPVVASGIGGIPELRPYRLCPPDSPDLFASAILEVVSMRYPEYVGDVCQRVARERHDPDRIRVRLMEVYEMALRRSRG